MNPKLSSTVSVVKISDEILEFFKTNIRQQIHLKVQDDTILKIVTDLDGTKTTKQISEEYDIKIDDLNRLLDYLKKEVF